MFSRYTFLALCATILFAVAVHVSGEDVAEKRELFTDLFKQGIKLIGEEFKAAESCLKNAAQECKSELLNPISLIKCAGRFIKENKEACLI